MRDRNSNYVPDRLSQSRARILAEIAPPRDGQPVLARTALGAADEHNRDPSWWWADTSGDGTHWAHFQAHHVQIDIELHTENWRDVSHWKGRDEIRPGGTWTLALARQQCWEGRLGHEPLNQLLDIRRVTQQMLEHPAIDWRSETPAAEQLLGRRVYYDRTPAVISSASVLSQGCVMLKPKGVEQFPPQVGALDDDEDAPDDGERGEIKTELLDPHIWWWRRKPAGDEQ